MSCFVCSAKSDHMTFVHFTTKPFRTVILSVAKNLYLRPFASLRVTHECANLVWFDLASLGHGARSYGEPTVQKEQEKRSQE